ncbi:zinc finger, CCHC-type containing protein [Tanacetum coccineum]
MDVAAMKHITSNFAKFDKFEGVDFIRRQNKMHFLLSSMSVVYVLTTLIPEDGGDDAIMEQIKKRNKWDNDDYNSLEAKYMAEDASSKKFLVSNFINYKMTDSRPVLEQYNELLDFKHTLKHLKEELTLVELGSHLYIEESLRMQDSDKPKSNNVAGPQSFRLTIVNNIGKSAFMSTFKLNDSIICLLHTKDEALDKLKVYKTEVKLHQRSLIKRFRIDRRGLSQGFWGEAMLTACYLLNRVPNKRNMITPYELWTKRKSNMNCLRVWGCRVVVRLPDPKLKTLGKRGIECIFVGYVEHSKAFRLSLVPRPSLRIPNGTEDIGGSVILEEVTKEVMTQQPKPELRKSKRNRTPKDFGLEFHLYLIEGTMDEVSDPKTFDEAMKSHDVAF